MEYLNPCRWKGKNHEEGLSDLKENVNLLPAQCRIMAFMSESKENQSFYANCEGFYSRRIVNATDTSSLHCFIRCTLFKKEDGPDTIDEVQRAKIFDIESNMIRISKRYFISPHEIHFTVIWVYYYDYENHEQKATPLFKIFKTRYNSDQAIFLDMELNTYDGWEEYLDNAALPESFLCVPRNGAYVCQPDSESPDLIYIISKSLRSRYLPRRTWKNFQPFSVSLAGAIIPKFNACNAAVIKKIEDFYRFLVDIWKEKKKVLRLVLYAMCFGLKVFLFNFNDTSMLLMSLKDAAFMLLNNTNEMSPPSIPEALEITPTSSSSYGGVENNFNFFTGSKPNWDVIFTSFVQYLRTEHIESLLKTCPTALSAFKVLRVIIETVNLIKITSEGGVMKAVKNDGDFPSTAKIENSNLEKMQVTFENNNAGVVAKARKLLGKIENNPEGISEAGESSHVNGSAPKMAPFAIPIDDESSSGTVYVFSSTKLAKINEGLGTIFKDFVYSPKTDREYEIIGADGRSLATLYVVKEFFAFAHVPCKDSS